MFMSLRRPRLHRPRRASAALGAAVALLVAAGPARAAGGHHAVDDAGIPEPGVCEIEGWLERADGRRLQHAGGACRVGPIEVGLGADFSREGGQPRLRSGGPQLKWSTELQPGLAVGAVWAAAWQNERPHFAGQTLLLPLSWQLQPTLLMHLNLGRDIRPGTADATLRGAALEWSPHERWQALAEWFHDGDRAHRRFGLRWLLGERWSLDISRARPQGVAREAWWTLGLNASFPR